MRTTITLDEDVAARLHERARKRGTSFKESVNEAIRAGLAAEQRSRDLPPYRIDRNYLVALKPGFNYDKVEDVFDALDSSKRLR